MTTSSLPPFATPKGLSLVAFPLDVSPPESSSPPPLAHADRKLIVGTAIRPRAADRLIRSRRPTPDQPLFKPSCSEVEPSCSEVDPMLKSSPSPGLRR